MVKGRRGSTRNLNLPGSYSDTFSLHPLSLGELIFFETLSSNHVKLNNQNVFAFYVKDGILHIPGSCVQLLHWERVTYEL